MFGIIRVWIGVALLVWTLPLEIIIGPEFDLTFGQALGWPLYTMEAIVQGFFDLTGVTYVPSE